MKILFLTTLLSTFAFGQSAEVASASKSLQEEEAGPWTELGAEKEGFNSVDLKGLKVKGVAKKDESEKDEAGEIIYAELEINDLVKNTGKKNAVIQVIDVSSTGRFCTGCVDKAKEIVGAIRADKALAKDTVYFMVISIDGATPPDKALKAVEEYLGDKTVTVLRDIDGQVQSKFATSRTPVTLVLDSKYRGKVLNMHKDQVSKITRTLNNLTKD